MCGYDVLSVLFWKPLDMQVSFHGSNDGNDVFLPNFSKKQRGFVAEKNLGNDIISSNHTLTLNLPKLFGVYAGVIQQENS